MKIKFLLTTAIILSACATTKVTSETANIIAICNAGVGDYANAEFSTALDKILSGAGSASATASAEMKGAFLNGPSVTSENADALYAKYLGCVDKQSQGILFNKLPDGAQIAQSIINVGNNNEIHGDITSQTIIRR